jgi:hypothetical protein
LLLTPAASRKGQGKEKKKVKTSFSNENNKTSVELTPNSGATKSSARAGTRIQVSAASTSGASTSQQGTKTTGFVPTHAGTASIPGSKKGPGSQSRVAGSSEVPATIVGGRLSDGASIRSTLTNSQSALYNIKETDLAKEEKARRASLQEYVRHDLFPKWKFFTSKKQIIYSKKKGGIVLKICNDLSVRKKHRQMWWDKNSKVITESLNRKRNDVTTYIKKMFTGE